MSRRITVVTSDGPFVEGVHLTIARSPVWALNENGFEADLILTLQNRFGCQFQAYLANRFTDVGEGGLGRKILKVFPEAYSSRKAVLTTSDSCGPPELIQDGLTGFIV
jgi:hypothetical protein